MTQLKQIYKCEICGNITEVLHTGIGELVCCGKPMILQTENTVDADTEKHVPMIEKTDQGFLVRVGSIAHPMSDDHYIEWIELQVGGVSFKKQLAPGQVPKAEFCIDTTDSIKISARAYCNLHGLWKSK